MTDNWKMKLGDVELGSTIVYTVSREHLLDMGHIEPTPEELAERNRKGRIFHAEQQAKRAKALAALDHLRGLPEPVTTAMLDLHSCDTAAQWSAECAGCDYGGYEAEAPEWPCRTVLALAEHHGVDMPNSLPGAHYEGEFVPSDGKVIDWSSLHQRMWRSVADSLDD